MRTRLYVGGVLGGLLLLVLVVVLVFALGRSNPSPPSLQANPRPEIPGEILYVNRESCFVRAEASGASSKRLACVPQFLGGSQLFWLEPDVAGFVRPDPSRMSLWKVDLSTGLLTDTGKTAADSRPNEPPFGMYGGAYAPDGTYASVDEDGTLVFLRDGNRTRVTTFDSPKYSPPQVVLWSPDSQWLLLRYYPRHAEGPETWIISRDASIQGTLLKNAGHSGFAWRIGDQVQPELPE